MSELSTIDFVVIALYFVVIVAAGLWAGRGEKDAEDYFLAGRRLPWYLIGFSFYASNMSGASFVGLMGASYAYGMVVFHYEWTASLVLIVLALVMLPVFLRNRLFTIPEYLERRFDRRSRWIYALFTILTLLFIDMAGAIYAGGVVIGTAFPDVGLWQTSAALAVLAGGYTLFGGLRAVVITDAMQAVLMIIGASLILVIGLGAVGGWEALMGGLDDTHTKLFKPANDDFMPWPGILGVILLGFYYWTLNQYFVQRALAARTPAEGRKGALFGGLLKLPNLFLMVVPGLIAVALFPNLENPDRAFPALAFELLPVGLRGLILTALIAAIMSSLDSAMNAAASLLTMDFVRPLRPQTSSHTLMTVGRLFTGVLIVIAACYAPLIERFGSLFQYFQSTLAYLVPVVVAVYLGGLLFRRTTAAAAFWAMVGGLAVGFVLFIAQQVTGVWDAAGLPAVHFTYMAIIMFALASAILLVVSFVTPAPEDALIESTVFRWSDLRRDGKRATWLQDDRWQAAALALLTVLIIAVVW